MLANELFDALPIYQYVMQEGRWHEKMLGLNRAGDLEFFYPEYSKAPFWHDNLAEGAVVEKCPDAIKIMEEISVRIKQYSGAAIIIDYGYINPEYKNTISAILNHKHSDILQDIGRADLSAHVDFGMLKNVAENNGVAYCGIINQGDFLRNMGIEIRVTKLSQNATIAQKNDLLAAYDRLVSDKKMGKLFKVLAVCSEGLVPGGLNLNRNES
jgi:SAM-dependent MidA family methyltransferase